MKSQNLSRKQLLKDVSTVTDAWLDHNADSPQSSRVLALRDVLTALLDDRQQLDAAQKILKGSVGRAKRAGESADDLISQMRDSASSLKNLNLSINDAADQLLDLIARPDLEQTAPSAPGRFMAQRWALPVTTDTGVVERRGGEPEELTNPGHGSEQTISIPPDWHVSETIAEEHWDKYIASHPEATHYHQRKWQKIIENNFPQQHWYVGVIDASGQIKGVLSLVYMNSRISGSYLLSMPWLIYGGCLSSDSAASELLAAYAKAKMAEIGCSHVELRQIHARSDWQLMPGKVSMVKSLPLTTQELNSGFGSALRSQIKGSTVHGPSIEFGGGELVNEFYSVFCEKMRDLGTPVYGRTFFKDIFRNFAESTTCVVVRLNNRPVAAAILIKHLDTMEVPWAAARKTYNGQGVNMFMYHQILEYSVRQGFSFFDFGRSTVGTGTYQFKKQWGAKPHALGWHRYPYAGSEGEDYPNEEMSLKFRIAISVWKKLPVCVTRIVGPPVSRHLPW